MFSTARFLQYILLQYTSTELSTPSYFYIMSVRYLFIGFGMNSHLSPHHRTYLIEFYMDWICKIYFYDFDTVFKQVLVSNIYDFQAMC